MGHQGVELAVQRYRPFLIFIYTYIYLNTFIYSKSVYRLYHLIVSPDRAFKLVVQTAVQTGTDFFVCTAFGVISVVKMHSSDDFVNKNAYR